MTDDLTTLRVIVAAQEDVTDAFLFRSHADQFLRAAQQLSGESAHKPDPLGHSGWLAVADVITHLFCHSMELYMKAFLSGSGMSVDNLKDHKIGHDLVALENECTTRGLEIPAHVSEIIAVVAPLHSRQTRYLLRYAQSSSYELLTPFIMSKAATLLKETIEKK